MQEENENTGATSWPPHKHALEKLQEQDRIRYGETIEWTELVDLINRGPVEGWRFRGEFLNLCAALKELGYMVTQRGMNYGGVRILNREEMADVVREREWNKARDSLRNSHMLGAVPREKLPDHESAKLDHWETKTGFIGGMVKVMLRKRTLPDHAKCVLSITKGAVSE